MKRKKPVTLDDPRPTGFWYYNPDYSLDTTDTALRTDGVYFRLISEDAFGDTYEIFRFYEDGLVIAYSVYSTPDRVLLLDKVKEKNIHGYFKAEADSLFFTTKVYYDHDPTFYLGKVFSDSLVLNSINYKKKEEANFTFYFLGREN